MSCPLAAHALASTLALAPLALAGEPSETLTVPTFGKVALYAPKTAPDQVVLFVSGDGGFNLGMVSMAERVRDLGALVVGIDIRAFLKSLESSKGCAYPAGALEELSRAVQLQRKLPAYESDSLARPTSSTPPEADGFALPRPCPTTAASLRPRSFPHLAIVAQRGLTPRSERVV